MKCTNVKEIKNNLAKGIEILGGKEILVNEDIDSLIIKSFITNNGKIELNQKSYSSEELLKCKSDYEKYLLLNKKKYIEKILFKIQSYDNALLTLIKSYNNNASNETYKEINNFILTQYKYDIDNYILNFITNHTESNDFYFTYLTQKREAFVNELFFKLIN